MDNFLVDYLRSGKAWLLVGSGASTAVGYPSWGTMASAALDLCRSETIGRDLARVEGAFRSKDYPALFEHAAQLVEMPRLLQHLESTLRPSRDRQHESVYKFIARWPIPVYLTTNFDHEILRSLSAIGEHAYVEYSNTEDHMSLLVPGTSGAIVHLHGDLRSEQGLVLTAKQYREISSGAEWEYWRTKMTSIFQMNRVVVLSHSLSDPHIVHVLAAAKKGAGVIQPVCWIAPDVEPNVVREYLEKYRIRVITYDNRDGSHRNLFRLAEGISDFIPPRLSVHLGDAIASASRSPLDPSGAAPGFFVFTKLSAHTNFEEKRIAIMVAALRATILRLSALPSFSISQALALSGWPASVPVPDDIASRVAQQAISEELLVARDGNFAVGPQAESLAKVDQDRFLHLRNRFQTSLRTRLKRDFNSLTLEQTVELATDIDAALTGYFREGGLTLASTLAATGIGPTPTIPSSVLRFINEASARYDDHLRRLAFSTVSLQAFVRADAAEREYLGRISQGFFAFHLLGVFGDSARERLQHAKETVWLVDSSAQIPAIALGSAANAVFRGAFSSLADLGIRLFTLEHLFDETREHLWFADRIVSENGASSLAVLAAARGETPYRKANLFLEGFINWQAAGNPADWPRYLLALSGNAAANLDAAREALLRLSIEAVEFGDWPGFAQEDHAEANEYIEKIIGSYESRGARSQEEHFDLLKKATPEAEAMVVVLHERDGKYHVSSEPGQKSHSWFLSQTAILNSICKPQKITWQPEAFVRFASTLAPMPDEDAANRAFEVLLWSLAQSGVTVLDERVITGVFGGIIDQARMSITEQHHAYEEVLGAKYGESIEKVLERVAPSYQPLAALQLANERAELEAQLRTTAEQKAREATKRAATAETELSAVQVYRRKVRDKQEKGKRRKRRGRSKKKGKKSK
jgi:SIR2-like domain